MSLIFWKHVGHIALGVYHIEHSRRNIPDPPGPVGEPRHMIVRRTIGDVSEAAREEPEVRKTASVTADAQSI